MEQHGDPSAARQGRPEPDPHRRSFARRRGRRARVVLQSAAVDQAGHLHVRSVPLDGSAGLGPYRFALTVRGGDRADRSAIQPITGPTVVPDRYLPDSRQPRRRRVDVRGLQHIQPRARRRPRQSDRLRRRAEGAAVGATARTTINSTRRGPSETPPATHDAPRRPGTGREGVLGAIAQALLLDRVEYMEVLRDHATAVAWMPAGATSCRNTRIRNASIFSTSRRGLRRHRSPCRYRERPRPRRDRDARLKDLVNSFAPVTTITLRLEWNAPGARLLLQVGPGTLPAERYKMLVAARGPVHRGLRTRRIATRTSRSKCRAARARASFPAGRSASAACIRTSCLAPARS